MQAFLASFGQVLDELPPAEFERYRASLIEARLERDKSLGEETGRDWAEIAGGTLNFARAADEVAALRELRQADASGFWRENCAPDAPRRRRLLVAIRPGESASPPPAPAPPAADAPPAVSLRAPTHALASDDDVARFKRAMFLFPAPLNRGSPPAPPAAGEASAGEACMGAPAAARDDGGAFSRQDEAERKEEVDGGGDDE